MTAFLIGATYNIKPRIGDNWHPKTICQSLTLSSLGGAIAPLAPPMDPPLPVVNTYRKAKLQTPGLTRS